MPAPTRSLTPTLIHQYVRQHCFLPRSEGWVGVELELLTTTTDDLSTRPPADELLGAVASVVPPGGSRITFEPGGQVELSSPPCPGASAAIGTTEADLMALRAGLAAAGISTVSVGLDHMRAPARTVGGGRYRAMEEYLAADAGAGLAMMCGTASVQVNLDLGDEAMVSRRWRLAHALGPVLVASFANSPLTAAGPTGVKSARQQIWAALDATRARPVIAATGPRSLGPAEAWARYAMAADVMLVRTGPNGFEPQARGLTFAAWMADGHQLGYPTLDDFAYHLTTLFPPVRPKGWLELRMIDAVPDPWWQVAVAVTTALLDDPAAFDVAEQACRPIAGRWAEAASNGLGDPALASAARSCFAAAIRALPGMTIPAHVMAATVEYAERYVGRCRTPGDDLLEAWLAAPSRRLAQGVTGIRR